MWGVDITYIPMEKGFMYLFDFIKFFFVHRFIKKGILIGFVGCDGTGKTTIAKMVTISNKIKP